jgi:hypothetical protein
MLASTSVYYLTQYVNKPGSSDSAPNYLVMKEATTNAWKRYMTVDNIYYKNMVVLSKDQQLLSNLNNYKIETAKETDRFMKDAKSLAKDKDIDKAFVTMINRRLDREKESKEFASKFYDTLIAIFGGSLPKEEKIKQITTESTNFTNYAQSLLVRAATEMEDLAKVLSDKYGQAFTLDEFLFYTEYKKGSFTNSDSTGTEAATVAVTINPKSITGVWKDGDNKISLLADKTMSYELVSGDKGTGSWKIEDNKLRLDVVSSISKQKDTRFFNISKITADSFTMTFDATPSFTYNLIRVKKK